VFFLFLHCTYGAFGRTFFLEQWWTKGIKRVWEFHISTFSLRLKGSSNEGRNEEHIAALVEYRNYYFLPPWDEKKKE